MRRRPSRTAEAAAEVNHLRFEVARLTTQAANMAELLEIERRRADLYERLWHKANATLTGDGRTRA